MPPPARPRAALPLLPWRLPGRRAVRLHLGWAGGWRRVRRRQRRRQGAQPQLPHRRCPVPHHASMPAWGADSPARAAPPVLAAFGWRLQAAAGPPVGPHTATPTSYRSPARPSPPRAAAPSRSRTAQFAAAVDGLGPAIWLCSPVQFAGNQRALCHPGLKGVIWGGLYCGA